MTDQAVFDLQALRSFINGNGIVRPHEAHRLLDQAIAAARRAAREECRDKCLAQRTSRKENGMRRPLSAGAMKQKCAAAIQALIDAEPTP